MHSFAGYLAFLAGEHRREILVYRVGAAGDLWWLAPDLSTAAVEATLWVRGGERWVPAIVRSSNVRPDDLPAGATDGLAEDPQVKAAFGVVEALGLGEVPPELKKRSLGMGAATRKALGEAKRGPTRTVLGSPTKPT